MFVQIRDIHFALLMALMIYKVVSTCDYQTKPGTLWTNRDGCLCECILLGDKPISMCNCETNKNQSFKFTTQSPPSGCAYLGLHYNVNEQWMSRSSNCTVSRCSETGQVKFSGARHCVNTCQHGQRARFSKCCEVSCSGAATGRLSAPDEASLKSVVCTTASNRKILHGESIIDRRECIDRVCTCSMSRLQCTSYCDLGGSGSEPLFFWDRLCCPRPIGHSSCRLRDLTLVAGAVLREAEQSCACLSGSVYCSKELVFKAVVNITVSKANIRVAQTTALPGPESNTGVIVVLIVFSITISIIICAAVIIFSLQSRKRVLVAKQHQFEPLKQSNFEEEKFSLEFKTILN